MFIKVAHVINLAFGVRLHFNINLRCWKNSGREFNGKGGGCYQLSSNKKCARV